MARIVKCGKTVLFMELTPEEVDKFTKTQTAALAFGHWGRRGYWRLPRGDPVANATPGRSSSRAT